MGESLRRSKPLLFLVSAFATVLLALLLLAVCTLLPQERIDWHVLSSTKYLLKEGTFPKTFDYSSISRLDNYTDSIMLEEARGTTRTNFASILTNPRHKYEDASGPVETLAAYAKEDADSPASQFYVRYWMGFRVLLRFLLVFFDYVQIRRYLSFCFFVLFFINVLAVSKYTNRLTAFLFALSVVLVRPQTIASSMQFSCCFFILFFAMLLTPTISRHKEFEGLFFFELGMITQYFDFYTTPLLTFGYPMVYLYLLYNQHGERIRSGRILKSFSLWMIGYVFMWIAKLSLTTWLTDVDGFSNGFRRLFYRIGISRGQEFTEKYNPLAALRKVFIKGVACDHMGLLVVEACLILLALAFAVLLFTKVLTLKALLANRAILIMALLPIAWFAVTSQPTVIHFWFQYRIVALTYWALGALVASSLSGRASGVEQPQEQAISSAG